MLRGYIYVLMTATLWSFGGLGGQFLYTNYPISAAYLVMLRQICAGLIFLSFAKWQGEDLLKPLREDGWAILIFSILGVFCCQYGFDWCVELSNAPTATVLQYFSPVLILFWETYRGRNSLDLKNCLGVLLAITGVFLICTHGDITSLHLSPLAFFAGIVGCFGMAFYKIQPIRLLSKYHIAAVLGWGDLFSGIGMIGIARPSGIPAGWNLTATIVFFGLLFGATIFTFWLDMRGIMLIGPVKSALICSWEPVCSVLGAVFLLNTELGFTDFMGIAMIVGMIILLALPKKNFHGKFQILKSL